jgi:hypothetical protein
VLAYHTLPAAWCHDCFDSFAAGDENNLRLLLYTTVAASVLTADEGLGSNVEPDHCLILEEKRREQRTVPALKLPRHCPLMLLMKLCSRKGKAIGRDEGKELGSGIYHDTSLQFIRLKV